MTIAEQWRQALISVSRSLPLDGEPSAGGKKELVRVGPKTGLGSQKTLSTAVLTNFHSAQRPLLRIDGRCPELCTVRSAHPESNRSALWTAPHVDSQIDSRLGNEKGV